MDRRSLNTGICSAKKEDEDEDEEEEEEGQGSYSSSSSCSSKKQDSCHWQRERERERERERDWDAETLVFGGSKEGEEHEVGSRDGWIGEHDDDDGRAVVGFAYHDALREVLVVDPWKLPRMFV